jgi:hypothetical protein
VRSWERNIAGGPTPDVFWGVVEFDTGVLGIIESTWLTPDPAGIPSDDILHLITDKGVASLDFARDGLSIWTESGYSIPDVTVAPRIRGRVEGALAAELSYFATCVQNHREPQVVRGEDALEGIRIAAARIVIEQARVMGHLWPASFKDRASGARHGTDGSAVRRASAPGSRLEVPPAGRRLRGETEPRSRGRQAPHPGRLRCATVPPSR